MSKSHEPRSGSPKARCGIVGRGQATQPQTSSYGAQGSLSDASWPAASILAVSPIPGVDGTSQPNPDAISQHAVMVLRCMATSRSGQILDIFADHVKAKWVPASAPGGLRHTGDDQEWSNAG